MGENVCGIRSTENSHRLYKRVTQTENGQDPETHSRTPNTHQVFHYQNTSHTSKDGTEKSHNVLGAFSGEVCPSHMDGTFTDAPDHILYG